MMQPIAGSDAGARLIHALIAHAQRQGVRAQVIAAEGRRWASATFEGMRHLLTLSLPCGPATDAWLLALPDAEMTPRGHVVVELAVERREEAGDRIEARLAALTLADD